MLKKIESSIYLHSTYDLKIMEIIKEFENGKASDIPTILIKNLLKLYRLSLPDCIIIVWIMVSFLKLLRLEK